MILLSQKCSTRSWQFWQILFRRFYYSLSKPQIASTVGQCIKVLWSGHDFDNCLCVTNFRGSTESILPSWHSDIRLCLPAIYKLEWFTSRYTLLINQNCTADRTLPARAHGTKQQILKCVRSYIHGCQIYTECAENLTKPVHSIIRLYSEQDFLLGWVSY